MLPKPQSGLLHRINTVNQNGEKASTITAFQLSTRCNQVPDKAILFIGGMGDGLLTVPYIARLTDFLDEGWCVFQGLLSSSYTGWGVSSLLNDKLEIAEIIKYLDIQKNFKKIVLMGHSSGCQGTMRFLLDTPIDERKIVKGLILQAPVSDREYMASYFKNLECLNLEAKQVLQEQGPDTVLPKKFSKKLFKTPITAYRWLSLTQKGGDDDMFSTDLEDSGLSETFGKIDIKIFVAYSEKDTCPEGYDKRQLLTRWQHAMKEDLWFDGSTVLKGASHNLERCGDGPLIEFLKLSSEFVKLL